MSTVFLIGLGLCLAFNTACRSGSARAGAFESSWAEREARAGQRKLDHGDNANAEADFRRAIALDPRNTTAHAGLAEIYTDNSLFPAACEHLCAVLRYDPENFEAALAYAACKERLAESTADRKHLQAAARAYCYARSLRMDDATAALRLAQCYAVLKEFNLAANTFKNVIDLDSQSVEGRIGLAQLYEAQSYDEAALTQYNEVLRIDLVNLAGHNGAGRVNQRLSQRNNSHETIFRERAAAHFRKSLQIEPNQPEIVQALNEIEPDTARQMAAIEDIEK